MNTLRLLFASSISTILTVVFVVLITIAAELSPSLKDLLKNLTGHHWVSKSILSVALYVVVIFLGYMLFQNVDAKNVRSGVSLAIWSAIIGSIVLFLFYTGHHLGWY